MVLTGRVGRTRRPDQPARADGGWAVRRGRALFGARRRGVVIDGVEQDIGLVGRSSGRPVGRGLAGGRPGASRLHRRARSGRRRTGPQCQRRHGRSCAGCHSAPWLVILTDVGGLCRLAGSRQPAVADLPFSGARDLLTQVDDGMIPSSRPAARPSRRVSQAHVIDGRQPLAAARSVHQRGHRHHDRAGFRCQPRSLLT